MSQMTALDKTTEFAFSECTLCMQRVDRQTVGFSLLVRDREINAYSKIVSISSLSLEKFSHSRQSVAAVWR